MAHTTDNILTSLHSILQTCLLFMTTVNTQTDNSSDLYLPLAFSPYFLSPETMTSLPDCELHLSTLTRSHAQNATFPLLIIVSWITSNRRHLCSTVLIIMTMYCILFYYWHNFFYWNLAVFVTCYCNNKLTYLHNIYPQTGRLHPQ